MTFLECEKSKTPALRSGKALLAAVSVLSLIGIAPITSAQTAVPLHASAQQTTTQAPVTEEAPVAVEDKYKPRVYGGATTVTAPTAAAPTITPAPQAAPIATLPKTAPVQAEQQVSVIAKEVGTAPDVNTTNTADKVDVNPNLPANSELNSAPNWTDGIRAQFVDVIVGAPIMVDPENCAHGNPALKIKVSNVKNSKGIIVADLHDDVKENFLDWEKVVLRVRATATEGETFFCMPVPAPGNYSVAIYHDKNSNAFFDKNFLGLPKERFGMSNNPKFTTKSPKFEEATFSVPAEGVEMEIKLRRTKDVISGNQD